MPGRKAGSHLWAIGNRYCREERVVRSRGLSNLGAALGTLVYNGCQREMTRAQDPLRTENSAEMKNEITCAGFEVGVQTSHVLVDVQYELWAYCHGEERFSYALVERPQADSKPKEGARARIDVEEPQSEVTQKWIEEALQSYQGHKAPSLIRPRIKLAG